MKFNIFCFCTLLELVLFLDKVCRIYVGPLLLDFLLDNVLFLCWLCISDSEHIV